MDSRSSIKEDILAKHRGSAVDAAIATMLCVGVVNFHNSGIGGGHFMIIYDTPNNGSTEKVMSTITARERAPLAATRDMFVRTNVSSIMGGSAIAVPGDIQGFYQAWLKFGKVPWKTLFTAAIDLCLNGFKTSSDLARVAAKIESIVRSSKYNLRELLVKDDDSLVVEGDIIKRQRLGKTLEIISEDPTAFYNPNSQLAKDIIADLQEQDSIITLEDLASYNVYDKKPVVSNVNNGGFRVYGVRPPSSGVVYQYILNILDGYNFNDTDMSSYDRKVLTLHRIIEAFKFAFAKRSQLADEDYIGDLKQVIHEMTSSEYGEHIRSRINDTHTQPVSYYEPRFQIGKNSGTSQASVYTVNGAAVSITSTINTYFGSKVVGRRTGIVFNNEMDDFSTPDTFNEFDLPPSSTNYIEPGKMPMSSMSPVIVLDSDGVVRLVTGASGGTASTTTAAFVSVMTLWIGLDIQQATDLPRLHHQLLPNQVRVERDFPQDIMESLKKLGHTVKVKTWGCVQSIYNTCQKVQDNLRGTYRLPCVHAVTDRRKTGRPDGY